MIGMKCFQLLQVRTTSISFIRKFLRKNNIEKFDDGVEQRNEVKKMIRRILDREFFEEEYNITFENDEV